MRIRLRVLDVLRFHTMKCKCSTMIGVDLFAVETASLIAGSNAPFCRRFENRKGLVDRP